MIAFVSGQVASTGPDGAVVDVGGVGLSVQCTPTTLASLRVGDRAHVPTSLVVREDSLALYGFADEDERSVFELLQTASGVGPRLALAMLAVHTPNALRRAVATEDLTALTQVPGIGKKGAQRIVLELKDRLVGPVDDTAPLTERTPAAAPWRAQVHIGLVNLGWAAKDADGAVHAVAADLDGQEPPDVAILLKSALRKLSAT
jgi:Holliday junction DNA helicase RuvA